MGVTDVIKFICGEEQKLSPSLIINTPAYSNDRRVLGGRLLLKIYGYREGMDTEIV